MASDRELGRRLLGGVADHVGIVLLHREDALTGAGPLSDLDCAVAPERRGDALRAVRDVGRDLGLSIVSVWPYDTAGLGLFLVDGELSRGVQLDLLADRDGRGKYGIRTRPLVEAAQPGTGAWRRPTSVDEALYLVSKRSLKGEDHRLPELVRGLAEVPDAEMRAQELLAPHARARVAGALGWSPPPEPARMASHARRAASEARRRARRITSPAGAWVHLAVPVGHPVSASALLGVRAQDLAPPLQWLGAAPSGAIGEVQMHARSLRPRVVLTAGSGSAPRAHATVDGEGSSDVVRSRLLTALADRSRQALRAYR